MIITFDSKNKVVVWVCSTKKVAEIDPARNAMRYYFEERTSKIFRGRKKTTIEDIMRTKEDDIAFPVAPLVSQVSLMNLYTKAKNIKLWSKTLTRE